MKNKILIISGDPNSINSEIIVKSWRKLSRDLRKKIILVSNFNLLKKQFKFLKLNFDLIDLTNNNSHINSEKLKVLNVQLKFKDPFNVPHKSASKFVKNCLDHAHSIALREPIKGIINCAIDKKLLNKNNLGVTEYLANKCKVFDNSEVMLIKSKNLSVCPITTHIDVKQISKKLKLNSILKKTKTIDTWYKDKFRKKPEIAMLGLNPHNAELKKNSEEKKIIIPAINKLRKKNLKIDGPFVADTFFINEFKNYDVVIGMYHDQVLVPFKSLYKFDAINITLGLKYLRASPDHGTAKKLIKRNKANPLSLIKCIDFINTNK